MTGKRVREADEQGGIGRGCLPILVFFVAVGEVHADADDFSGAGTDISQQISEAGKSGCKPASRVA